MPPVGFGVSACPCAACLSARIGTSVPPCPSCGLPLAGGCPGCGVRRGGCFCFFVSSQSQPCRRCRGPYHLSERQPSNRRVSAEALARFWQTRLGQPSAAFPHPFLNTVRRWLPRERAHSWRARHTRTPTPTPGDSTNTGLHPPHYPAHYRPPLRTRAPQDRRGKRS